MSVAEVAAAPSLLSDRSSSLSPQQQRSLRGDADEQLLGPVNAIYGAQPTSGGAVAPLAAAAPAPAVDHMVGQSPSVIVAASARATVTTTATLARARSDSCATAAASEAATTPPPPAVPRRYRILAAEDNAVNQRILIRFLRRLGHHEVEMVPNGQAAVAAVAAAEGAPPDLVLMDCQMPVMDGYEATRRIRALPDLTRRSIPVIAVSASTLQDDVARSAACGMNDHLPKPYSLEALALKLRRWLPPTGAAESNQAHQVAEAAERRRHGAGASSGGAAPASAAPAAEPSTASDAAPPAAEPSTASDAAPPALAASSVSSLTPSDARWAPLRVQQIEGATIPPRAQLPTARLPLPRFDSETRIHPFRSLSRTRSSTPTSKLLGGVSPTPLPDAAAAAAAQPWSYARSGSGLQAAPGARYVTPSINPASAQPRALPSALSGSLAGARSVYSHSISETRSASPPPSPPLVVASVRPDALQGPLLVPEPSATRPSAAGAPYPDAMGAPHAVPKGSGDGVLLAAAPGATGAVTSRRVGHLAARGLSTAGRTAGAGRGGRAPALLLPATPGGLSEVEQSSPRARAVGAPTTLHPSAAPSAPPAAVLPLFEAPPPAAHPALALPRLSLPRESSVPTPSSGSGSGGAAVSRPVRLQVGRLWRRLPLPAFPWCTGPGAAAGAVEAPAGTGTVQLGSTSAASALPTSTATAMPPPVTPTAVPLTAQRGVGTDPSAAASGTTQRIGRCAHGGC
jgi:CheY-like chemotaxis protein